MTADSATRAHCPMCGHLTVPAPTTDAQVMAALQGQDHGMVYAVGRPDGSADKTRWRITRGAASVTPDQVQRLVRAGKLVEYLPGSDAAYTTPAIRRSLDAARVERDQRNAQRARARAASMGGAA